MLAHELQNELVLVNGKSVLFGVVEQKPWRKARRNKEPMTVFSISLIIDEAVSEDSPLFADNSVPVFAFGSVGDAAYYLEQGTKVAFIGEVMQRPGYSKAAINLSRFIPSFE